MKISSGLQKCILVGKQYKENDSKKGGKRVSVVDDTQTILGLKSSARNLDDKKSLAYRILKKAVGNIKYFFSYKKGNYNISKPINKENNSDKCKRHSDAPITFHEKAAKKLDKCQKDMSLDEINIKINKNRFLPFRGILAFFKAASVNDVCDKDAPYIVLRAKALLSLCNKPGDAVVLTFSGNTGIHSAILAYDEFLGEPVYLSFGKMRSFDPKGGGLVAVCEDILAFKDMVDDNNIVKIEGFDTQIMLDKWRNSIENKSFNVFTRNCSGISRKLLILGAKDKLAKQSYKHNRVWQMPLNTHNLALEIKFHMKKSSE